MFTVLPLRLSTACYLFTNLMQPLIRYWWGRGLKAIVYLDDGIVAVKGKEEALVESARVKQAIESAGFLLMGKKAFGNPPRLWSGLAS